MQTDLPPVQFPTQVPPSSATNTLAMTSMVLGIVSLPMLCLGAIIPLFGLVCTCAAPLLGIAAVATGYLAREQIKTSGERGGSMALAGMIIGALQLALLLCSIVLGVILILFDPSIGNVFSSINNSLK